MEQHLEQEQEFQVNKLMKKIKKMENETISKQLTLEQVCLFDLEQEDFSIQHGAAYP